MHSNTGFSGSSDALRRVVWPNATVPFFEVRMAAGPTVTIEGDSPSPEGYRVTVGWGNQQATTHAVGARVPDGTLVGRLACTLARPSSRKPFGGAMSRILPGSEGSRHGDDHGNT